MDVQRRKFIAAAGAAAAMPLLPACSRGGDDQRPAGVPVGPFGSSSTAEEVTAGLDLSGKTALVTGATSGLGLETLRVLALRGAHVIATGRTLDKAQQACASVTGRTTPIALELERWDSVVAATDLVKALGMPIDMLICNAGIMALPKLEQVYGIEKHFVVNHLGHFILTNRLLPQVQAAAQGRVVVVSSLGYQWAPPAGIEFDNLSGERGYEPNKMYGQSKLANGLFSLELARRLRTSGSTATSNSVHPRHHSHQPRPSLRRVEAHGQQAHRLDVHEEHPRRRGDDLLRGHGTGARRRERTLLRELQSRGADGGQAHGRSRPGAEAVAEIRRNRCGVSRMKQHLFSSLAAATLLCMLPLTAAHAQDVSATAARAQSLYFAGNSAELAKLATSTMAWSKSQNPRELYAHAYVQFRVLQLAIGGKREAEAEKSGEACIGALDAAVKRDPKFAEAFALQSVCYGYLANLGGMGAIRNGSRSGKSMAAALALDARSPRILLVDGFGVYFRPKFVGGDKAKGCARFREAAAGFDAAGAAGLPGQGGIDWGAAEAHYWAGRCARDAGDAANARKFFERALAIAPDFLAASKALGR